jgi:transposase
MHISDAQREYLRQQCVLVNQQGGIYRTGASLSYTKKLASGFFRPGDILVLDNASIHNGGDNNILEEWLWDNFGVLLLFLPARSPELNPIEQVWKLLVNRLKRVPLSVMRNIERRSN